MDGGLFFLIFLLHRTLYSAQLLFFQDSFARAKSWVRELQRQVCISLNKSGFGCGRLTLSRLIPRSSMGRGIPTLSLLSLATNLISRQSERCCKSPALCYVVKSGCFKGQTRNDKKEQKYILFVPCYDYILPTQVEVEEAKQYAEENRYLLRNCSPTTENRGILIDPVL